VQLKRLGGLALGVVAAIGGFVDFAGIINAAQAGTHYRFALLWTLISGVIGLIVYTDMAGRVAIASGRTLFDVVRSRLGYALALVPLGATLIVNTVTLVIEIAGMALIAELAIGGDYRLWLVPAALLLAVILWRGSFALIEDGAAVLGMAMGVAVVATWRLGPPWGEIASATLHPELPDAGELPAYLFAAVGLLGSYMTPYQFYFYSSGAIEEEWDGQDLVVNRATAVLGSVCGSTIYAGLILVAALVLFPRHAEITSIADAGQPIREALGSLGWAFFLFGVFAVSLGAGLENALAGAYALCQYVGWDWGKEGAPAEAPLFHFTYLAMLLVALAVAGTGVDPVKLAAVTMAVAGATLPFTFVPLLAVANDRAVVGDQHNNVAINVAAGAVLAILVVVALAAIPLLLLSGGGS
jgi:Mn2+/Fe2+ NRAMP family transporter